MDWFLYDNGLRRERVKLLIMFDKQYWNVILTKTKNLTSFTFLKRIIG